MSVWQLVGLLSLIITLAGGLTILIRNPTQTSDSISYHIASKPHYFMLMGLVLTVAGFAFYGFLIFWLIPEYQLPQITYWIVIVSFIAQLLVAWIPARPKTVEGRIHAASGITVGTAMVLCISILVLYGQNVPLVALTLSTIAAITTPLSYIALSVGLLRAQQLILPSEIIMIGFFSLALIALSLKI